MNVRLVLVLVLFLVVCPVGTARFLAAQTAAGLQLPEPPPHPPPSHPAAPALSYAGPQLPPLPDLVARDEQGRTTIRAVWLTAPLRLDGRLDEVIYDALTPISDFIQTEPQEGVPASERTDVWLMFDRDAVYVTLRCWESQPERMVLNEMRRDSFNLLQNEGVAFMFDTFYDRRNAVVFNVTPLGGRMDGQVTNERQYNGDWNPVWDVAVGRFEGGWTVEAAIPFKSLRYSAGQAQLWGFNVRRTNRWKNELSFLTRIPNSLGQRGIFQASMAATVVGLEVPAGSRNLELKPYAIADLTSDLAASPRVSNDPSADLGVDLKYGVTQNLTADFTYNTDFAQVEADEQQVNLTRFSLFFPEKREFFLENQGIFQFGGAGGGGGPMAGLSETPVLFYSRRIGFNRGREIPIQAGGRLTGRVGPFSVGLLNIRTGDESVSQTPSTNFSVLRLKRDILRRSSIGLIATHRSNALSGPGSNASYGLDGNFAFFTNLSVATYWARTDTTGRSGDETSYRLQVDYGGDRYGAQAEHLVVGDAFNPETGFLRRDDMRRSFAQLRFSPRPARLEAVRKFSWTGSFAYIEDLAGNLETRETDGEFGIEFQNSDRMAVSYTEIYEFLDQPFPIARDVTIPAGGYAFWNTRASYTLGQQRTISGNLTAERGAFYGGERTSLTYTRGRAEITPRVSVEPSLSLNWVDLPAGSFTTRLLGSRVTYTVTPLMFFSALVQYNAAGSLVGTNARLRWEYRPGSELFVVYNEERDTLGRRLPDLRNRTVVVKVNRLFRF